MSYRIVKTEHVGAKNGGGAWMTRAEAKAQSKRRRRLDERRAIAAQLAEHDRPRRAGG